MILSTAKNVWGSYFYEKDQDVVRVAGKISRSAKNIEAFSMAFGKDMTLHMGWGTTVVSVPVK